MTSSTEWGNYIPSPFLQFLLKVFLVVRLFLSWALHADPHALPDADADDVRAADRAKAIDVLL